MFKKRGFTLIEMVVTISVLGLALPVLFAIIFMILKEETKIVSLSEIKRQGDFALNVMENTINNNATGIYSDSDLMPVNKQCNTTGTYDGTVYFMDKDRNWFNYYLNGSTIASGSSVLTTPDYIDLTTSKVRIENFVITCSSTADFSTPIVNIAFDVCHNNNSNPCSSISTHFEENALLHYQASIKLKNY